jgi:hypothetical protein
MMLPLKQAESRHRPLQPKPTVIRQNRWRSALYTY